MIFIKTKLQSIKPFLLRTADNVVCSSYISLKKANTCWHFLDIYDQDKCNAKVS